MLSMGSFSYTVYIPYYHTLLCASSVIIIFPLSDNVSWTKIKMVIWVLKSPGADTGNYLHALRFGIAFDIDGVLLRGGKPIGGAPRALQQLYESPADAGRGRIPLRL